MKVEKEYKIAFSALPLGDNNFHFHVSNDFFECFDYGEIKKGSVDVDIVLIKEETMLVLEFDMLSEIKNGK